jgi:hypothetical protein
MPCLYLSLKTSKFQKDRNENSRRAADENPNIKPRQLLNLYTAFIDIILLGAKQNHV